MAARRPTFNRTLRETRVEAGVAGAFAGQVLQAEADEEVDGGGCQEQDAG